MISSVPNSHCSPLARLGLSNCPKPSVNRESVHYYHYWSCMAAITAADSMLAPSPTLSLLLELSGCRLLPQRFICLTTSSSQGLCLFRAPHRMALLRFLDKLCSANLGKLKVSLCHGQNRYHMRGWVSYLQGQDGSRSASATRRRLTGFKWS